MTKKTRKQKKKTNSGNTHPQKPVHILVECPDLIASVRVGVLEPLQPLVDKGICEVQFIKTLKIKKADIAWSDIFITVRGSDPITKEIVRIAKNAKRLIIYYLDDDLLNVPLESIVGTYYADPDIQKNIQELIGMSDVLWGVNRNIKEKYLPYTKGKWIENKVPIRTNEFPKKKYISYHPLRILYAGSKDHEGLVREVLRNAVVRIAEEYKENVEFVFVGVNPGIKGLENVFYYPYFDSYEAYREFIEQGDYAIGLGPGRDAPFYACKYYNKFVEYASISAVGIFTKAEPYTQIVIDGKNGILCGNTEEQWYEAIKGIIEDNQIITQCRNNIRKQIAAEFEPNHIANSLIGQYPEFGTYHTESVEIEDIPVSQTYVQYFLYRIKIILRQKGIRGIPEIMRKSFKTIQKFLIREIK